MAKNRAQSNSLATLVDQFAASLSDLLERTSIERARQAVLSAFGGNAPAPAARRGRPPGSGRVAAAVAVNGAATTRKRRKKAPIQLCPVPGCKNRAAPVFGMVCSKHKDLPKAKVRAFREARRAKREKA
jgi:hypothetical protein